MVVRNVRRISIISFHKKEVTFKRKKLYNKKVFTPKKEMNEARKKAKKKESKYRKSWLDHFLVY